MKNLKKVLSISLFLVATQFSLAQTSFSHSLGAGFYVSPSASAYAPAIVYSPRLNFLELADEATISVGTHLGLGLLYNSREGASSYALDLPVVVEFNLGHGAHPDTRSSFGGYAGFGFGISKIGSSGAFGADYNDAAGVVLNGGLRALIQERPLDLRVSYLLNVKEGFGNVIGLGISYSFGDY